MQKSRPKKRRYSIKSLMDYSVFKNINECNLRHSVNPNLIKSPIHRAPTETEMLKMRKELDIQGLKPMKFFDKINTVKKRMKSLITSKINDTSNALVNKRGKGFMVREFEENLKRFLCNPIIEYINNKRDYSDLNNKIEGGLLPAIGDFIYKETQNEFLSKYKYLLHSKNFQFHEFHPVKKFKTPNAKNNKLNKSIEESKKNVEIKEKHRRIFSEEAKKTDASVVMNSTSRFNKTLFNKKLKIKTHLNTPNTTPSNFHSNTSYNATNKDATNINQTNSNITFSPEISPIPAKKRRILSTEFALKESKKKLSKFLKEKNSALKSKISVIKSNQNKIDKKLFTFVDKHRHEKPLSNYLKNEIEMITGVKISRKKRSTKTEVTEVFSQNYRKFDEDKTLVKKQMMDLIDEVINVGDEKLEITKQISDAYAKHAQLFYDTVKPSFHDVFLKNKFREKMEKIQQLCARTNYLKNRFEQTDKESKKHN